MLLDPTLVGHETHPETATITEPAVREFANAISDQNAIYRSQAAAREYGFAAIPAPPTFVTRFRVPFEEAGLDVNRLQVLHVSQEYVYTRPLYAGDTVTVRHRIATIRQTARAGGTAIMTIEQLVDAPDGARIVTGSAKVIVSESGGGDGASASAPAKGRAPDPLGNEITRLSRFVTQAQIDAYAGASGDHNPIHVDAAAARAVGLDGTIAHGMLSMAFAGQQLTDWLVTQPQRGGWVQRLQVRFQAMVKPGDTVTSHAVLQTREGDRQRLGLWMDNERGEQVLSGLADVVLAPGV